MGPQSADLLKSALQSASEKPSGTLGDPYRPGHLVSDGLGRVRRDATVAEQNLEGHTAKGLDVESGACAGGQPGSGRRLGVPAADLAGRQCGDRRTGDLINAHLPFGSIILGLVNAIVSFSLIALLFAAIYKVLPDRTLQWRDVIFGAIVTAVLFTVGKSLIGWYLGSSAIASSYGAAGGLLIALLWVFYSSVIFLVGAEITRAYSVRYGSRIYKGVRPKSVVLVDGEAQPDDRPIFGLSALLFAGAGATLLLSYLRVNGGSDERE